MHFYISHSFIKLPMTMTKHPGLRMGRFYLCSPKTNIFPIISQYNIIRCIIVGMVSQTHLLTYLRRNIIFTNINKQHLKYISFRRQILTLKTNLLNKILKSLCCRSLINWVQETEIVHCDRMEQLNFLVSLTS